MEEASFMEHIKTAPSDDQIFRNPMDGEDDDESFVPDSLRAFMEDANAKLDADLSDILSDPKAPPKTTSHWVEDDDDDDMDEDPPPPSLPDMDIANSILASTVSSRAAAAAAAGRSHPENNNDAQESIEYKQEEDPILSRLQHILDMDPSSLPKEQVVAQGHKVEDESYTKMTTRDLLKPKPIPDPDALDDDDETEDDAANHNRFFRDILQQEEDLSLKHNLMMGLLDEDAAREKAFQAKQQQLEERERKKERERLRELQMKREQHYYEEDSVPPLESMNAPMVHPPSSTNSRPPESSPGRILESKVFEDYYEDDDDIMEEFWGENPAAHLTVGQARDMAMNDDDLPALENEDALPKRDLGAALLKAEQDFGTSATKAKNPSPSKRPKLGDDSSSDYDQIESEMDRSYVSSSSEEGKIHTKTNPLSPPSIVHQTDTPPSLQEVKQTLQLFFNPATATTSADIATKTKTAANRRLQPPMPELVAPKETHRLLGTLESDLNKERDLLQQVLELKNKAQDLLQAKSPQRAGPKPDVLATETTKTTTAQPIKHTKSSKLLDFLHPNIHEKEAATSIFHPPSTRDAKIVDHRQAIETKSSSAIDGKNRTTPVKTKRDSPPAERDGTPPKPPPPKTPDLPMIQTPPSMSQRMKQSDATPPSPAGAVDNIFDYLHPTNEKQAKSQQQQQYRNRNNDVQQAQRKQLFAGPSATEPKRKNQPPSNDHPAGKVITIPPVTVATTRTTTITSPSMSRTTIQPIASSSPTSSIGFGSPTSELRRRRQMVQEQQQQQSTVPNSPMSMASTTRRQGHSPLVHRKNPPREVTSPDENIPSRLLQGTAATRAKYPRTRPTEGGSTIKGMAKTRVAAGPATESTNSTALDDPKVTRARTRERMSSKRVAAQSNREKKAEQKRNIKSTMDRVRERKERLAKMEQERVAKLKAKIAERETKTQERKAKLAEERTSPQKAAVTEAAKTRTTRSTKSSIPRPPTIPKTPNFLTDKRLRRLEPKEEMVPLANADNVFRSSFRDDLSMGSNATGQRKLTIPKGPNFETDKRLKPREKSSKEEMVPLANADVVLRRSFRDDLSSGGGSPTKERRPTIPKGPNLLTSQRASPEKPRQEMIPLAAADSLLMRSFRDDQSSIGGGGSTTGERRLTIPKTPNLVTKQKYGDKSTAKRGVYDNEGSVHHWQDGLRTATSPSNKSVCSQLTIPQTPNFQPERRRQPAMSTAEREQAEMDYYKAHPFKARPVGSGIKPFSSTAKKQVEKPKLTVPKPFRLSSGKRTSPDQRDESSTGQPKTLFPPPRGTPAEGYTMKKKRSTTTPKPFRLSTSRRQSFSPTESADGSGPPEATNKFHARPMPNFDNISIPVRDKDPTKLRSPPSNPPEDVKPFRASGVPKSLSKPSIPVRRRDPSKLRSPDYVKTSPEDFWKQKSAESGVASPEESSKSKPFRARRAPIRSPPDIPVRGKDPRKLRPVASKQHTVPAPPSLAGSSFGSSASSLEPRIDKRKAIRENIRQRMKERHGKSESVTTTDSSSRGVGASMDTTSNTESGDFAPTNTKIGQDVPVPSASPNAQREKSLLQAAMKKWPKGEPTMAFVPSTESEASTPVTKGGQSKKEELQSAMGGWMFDSVPATVSVGAGRVKPKAAKDRISEIRRTEPDPLEAARLAEEQRKLEEQIRLQNRSKSLEETTEMALQLQQQLEDALSFEATYSAGDDLDQGYIGQPAGRLGHFDL